MSGIVDSKHTALCGLIEKYGIENAQIESTSLGVEDHGFLTSYLHLKYNRGGQGFGGRVMSVYSRDEKMQRGTAFGCDYIIQLLETVGVGQWEKLKGKYIRVIHSHSEIFAIGNVIEDKWFVPERLAREIYGEKESK